MNSHPPDMYYDLYICCMDACRSQPPQVRDIVGRYIMNQGPARDMIDVFPNGRYMHTYMRPGEQPIVERSTWTLEDLAGDRIVFHDFRSWPDPDLQRSDGNVWPSNMHPPEPALYPALIDRQLGGGIALMVDMDVDWKFVKVMP